MGDSPKAAQWRGAPSQERRWDILFEIGDVSRAKILDFGCGTGAMLAGLRRRFDYSGEYVGADISDGMLKIARAKFPACASTRSTCSPIRRRRCSTTSSPRAPSTTIMSMPMNSCWPPSRASSPARARAWR